MSYTQFVTHEVKHLEARFSEATCCLTFDAKAGQSNDDFAFQFFLGSVFQDENQEYHDRAKRAVAAFNEAFNGGETDAG